MTAPDCASVEPCPVCLAPARPLLVVDGRAYWACSVCEARFLDPGMRPTAQQELAHYRHHQNDPDDSRYRRFLSKLAGPLLERLPGPSEGLDYGCGPGPALAAMLREAGHTVALYDPFFAPDVATLAARYDFITCSETAEHFHRPAEEFARLMAMVRPGGWLAIMTCFQTDDALFAGWRYRMDPTHVVFYREETFRVIGRRTGWTVDVPLKDVVLMRCPARLSGTSSGDRNFP